MTLYMGDTASTDPNPPAYELSAVAGYVAGYVTYPTLVDRWSPAHPVLSISPNADTPAECLDIETGDAVASQAGPWVREMRAHGIPRPCVYAQASRMGLVRESLDAAGLARSDYRLWVADWDNEHEVPDGYDAKQFYGTISGSWDYSVIAPDFFAGAPIPQPPSRPAVKSMFYDWFMPWERTAVERYDVLRELDHKGHLTSREKPYLLARRAQCAFHARWLRGVAVRQGKHGHPAWSVFHRGWRFRELSERGAGKRVLPS